MPAQSFQRVHDQFRPLLGAGKKDTSLTLLKDATSEIRETAHNLMPTILHEKGLKEAVEGFCAKLSNSRQLQVEFQSYGPSTRLHHHFELMVYRTIQELINNVIKHAHTTRVLVQLGFHGDTVSIAVEDMKKVSIPGYWSNRRALASTASGLE